MRAPEGFRTLAEALLAPLRQPIEEPAVYPPPQDSDVAENETRLSCEMRLFRARIAEAVEAAAERALADIACDVLARELRIAPAEVTCIIERALQRYASDIPVRVRVHPDDANIHCDVPVVADDKLLPGDAILELQDGFIDARLGVRLESVLRGAIA